MAHTPGPWIFKHDKDLGMSEHDDPEGSRLIEAGMDTLLMGTRYYPGTPDNIADWYLIAAAPDMLAALKYGLDLLEHYGACEQVDAMRAAIAKAESGPQGIIG